MADMVKQDIHDYAPLTTSKDEELGRGDDLTIAAI